MAIHYLCSDEIGCAFGYWFGTVTLEDWLDTLKKQFTDPKWPTERKILADMRNVTDLSSIFESDLQEIATWFSLFPEKTQGLRIAVVSRKVLPKVELFKTLISQFGVTMIVAKNSKDACSWLEIDHPGSEDLLNQIRKNAPR